MRHVLRPIFFVIAAGLSFAASDTPLDRQSLRDLDGVRVTVDDLPGAAVEFGITQDQIRKQIEDGLRAARIPVLNSGEFPVGDPALRLHLAIATEAKGVTGFTIEMDFVQIVFMRRNPGITFNRAQTWSAGSEMALTSRARMREDVRRAIAAQLEKFVVAYRSVNPK